MEIIQLNGLEYEIVRYGSNPLVYLFASQHVWPGGNWKDFGAQEEFIRQIKPGKVLHEFFRDAVYNPKNKRFTLRNSGDTAREFQEYLEIEEIRRTPLEFIAVKKLADRLGHIVVGCDSRAHLVGVVPDKEREIEQAEVIEANQGTIDRPNIAIIGAFHCFPSSNLSQILQRHKINYACLYNLERVLA
jgi:hypothetical protein